MARRAGMIEAASATKIKPNKASRNEIISPGWTPKSMERMRRAPAMATGTPARMAAPLTSRLSRKINHSTCPCCAPRAMRTPISEVRRSTRLGERAIQASGDQQHGDDAKKDGEAGKEAGLRVRLDELSALGHGLLYRKIGIEDVENSMDGGDESFGIAVRAQLDLHVGDRSVLREGEVESGLRFFVDTLIFAVADDADDGEAVF